MTSNAETPGGTETQFSGVRQRLGFDVDRESLHGDGNDDDDNIDKPKFSPGNPFLTLDYTPKDKNPFGTQCFENVRIVPTPIVPITLAKFTGTNEDPEKFLSDFEAMMQIQGIDGSHFGDSVKMIASFSLHLKGSAFVWFKNLPEDPFHISWTSLKGKFQEHYVSMNPSTNMSLYAESAAFSNLQLGSQTLDDFHCEIVQKGHRLRKTPLDIMCKFIDGLPSSLQYFVRAGRPNTVEEALQSAKMGEAFGYRFSGTDSIGMGTTTCITKPVSVNAVKRDTTIDNLQQQIQNLTAKVDSLATSSTRSQPRVGNRPTVQTFECYSCRGQGHRKAECCWAGRDVAKPETSCQICSQHGHPASDCTQFLPPQNRENQRGSVVGRGRPRESH